MANETPEDKNQFPRRRELLSSVPLLRIIGPVLIGLLLVVIIFLFLRTRSQSARVREEIQKNESTGLRMEDMEQNMSRHLSRINELQNELNTTAAKRDQFQSEVTSLKTDQARLETQLENSQNYQKTLQERLRTEEATLARLQTKFDEERVTQKMLFSKIERLMEEKSTLKEQIAKLGKGTSAVTMPRLVVSQEQPSPPSLEGTILAVNRRYDFVVFNLGGEDGVKAGDHFAVYDHEQKVGELVARRVLSSLTVADIVAEETRRKLRKNFSVTLHE